MVTKNRTKLSLRPRSRAPMRHGARCSPMQWLRHSLQTKSLTYHQLLTETIRTLRSYDASNNFQTRASLVTPGMIRSSEARGSTRCQQWTVEGENVHGGILNGLEKGSIVALFDTPAANNDDAPIGHGHIVQATSTEARMSPIKYSSCQIVDAIRRCEPAPLPAAAKVARLVEPAFDFSIVFGP